MSPLSRDVLVRLRSMTVSGCAGRAINLTGDFAEQFDFKVEGDFGQGDGLNSNRTAFFSHGHLR